MNKKELEDNILTFVLKELEDRDIIKKTDLGCKSYDEIKKKLTILLDTYLNKGG